MSEIEDKASGMRVRFVKKWDIIPDQNPQAFTLAVCPECLAQLIGMGATLPESIVDADTKLADHKCQHLATKS